MNIGPEPVKLGLGRRAIDWWALRMPFPHPCSADWPKPAGTNLE